MDNDKFWLENPYYLLNTLRILPIQSDSYERRMNILTRTLLFISAVLLLLKWNGGLYFFIFSLSLIIILYYSQRSSMATTSCPGACLNVSSPLIEKYTPLPPTSGAGIEQERYRVLLDNDSRLLLKGSTSDALGAHWTVKHGPPNPKTQFPPVIAPPLADSSFWGNGTYSAINTQNIRYLSGNEIRDYEDHPNVDSSLYKPEKYNLSRKLVYEKPLASNVGTLLDYPYHPSTRVLDEKAEMISGVAPHSATKELKQNYSDTVNRLSNLSGMADTLIGEDNTHLRDVSLPSTLSVEGKEDFRFRTEDGLLHRQTTVDPNFKLQQEIIEPINANNGVSFLPQNYDVEDPVGSNSFGNYSYTHYDPQFVRDEESLSVNRAEENPSRGRWSQKLGNYDAPPGSIPIESIYDPRFSGYGDGYRGYYDLNSGRYRYYYRNVDAYKYPLFVAKSKVDHIDQYSPSGEVWARYELEQDPADYRKLAESKYTADDLFHREDIMSKLMRKQNRREWQLRVAPIRRNVKYP